MPTYQKILIVAVILAALGIHFIGRPAMYRRQGVKTLETIMNNWKNGDFTVNYLYWQDRALVPPIDRVNDYAIVQKNFIGFKKGYFNVSIEFPKDAILPSGKNWKVEMTNTRDGWKVENFTLIKEGSR